MVPCRPAVQPATAVRISEEWSPSARGVAGRSLESLHAQIQQRKHWLKDQARLVNAARADLFQRERRFRELCDERRRRLQEAVRAHKQLQKAAEERIKQMEEAAIQALNEADAILDAARSRRDQQLRPCATYGGDGPPHKKPRGSAGLQRGFQV